MDFYEWKFQTLYPQVERHLRGLGYAVHQTRGRGHALEVVLGLLPRDEPIALCGCDVLEEIGLRRTLRAGDYALLDPSAPAGEDERLALCRQGLTAGAFVSGVSAITRDGRLLFSDPVGYRSAAVLFGPRRVILVAGMNRIVPDVELAIRRLRGETPPAEEGAAAAPAVLPRSLTVIESCQGEPGRIQIVLVMEQLGE